MKDISEIKSKIDQLKKSIADYGEKENGPSYEDLYKEADALWRQIADMRASMDDALYKMRREIYDMFSQHIDGHLPPVMGPEKMQKAIEALGIGGDYQVQKRYVYASTGKVEEEIVELRKKCGKGGK